MQADERAWPQALDHLRVNDLSRGLDPAGHRQPRGNHLHREVHLWLGRRLPRPHRSVFEGSR